MRGGSLGSWSSSSRGWLWVILSGAETEDRDWASKTFLTLPQRFRSLLAPASPAYLKKLAAKPERSNVEAKQIKRPLVRLRRDERRNLAFSNWKIWLGRAIWSTSVYRKMRLRLFLTLRFNLFVLLFSVGKEKKKRKSRLKSSKWKVKIFA